VATDLQNLVTARSALYAALATNAGKPNYNIDGQSFTWGELMDRIEKINAAIDQGQGPFEISTEGST